MLTTSSVFHGGGDDLNRALSHLSWKEMTLGAGIALGVLIVIVATVVLTQ